MKHLPKLKDFQTPEGYFDRLPDQILAKATPRRSYSWTKYAAAAVVLLGLGLTWQLGGFDLEDQPISMDEEANLYIESQVWTAEDVLSLTDNPNALLDQIIEEEMPAYDEMWVEDESNWF
ncbi:hypothetical protein [Algoriphagus terrigena]|uniref:hypothetical protein n=1 Tax=Algoriphagus terrigena TaxID=344884 RepID=UPI0004094E93|nr:hypothetical protein [Algoriphagus terrigena]